MRRFLLRVVGFLGVAALGYAVLLMAVIALNWRTLDECRVGEGVEAVILGDSHTMWGIDDEHIPGLRNISLNAEGYRYTYDKLGYLLDHEPQVKHVYLGVGYHNFAGYFDDYIYGDSFKFFAHRYLPFMSAENYAELAEKNPSGLFDLSKYLVKQGAGPALKGECQAYGTFPEEKHRETFDPEHMKERIQEQFFPEGTLAEPSTSNVRYLRKIVELCREREVRLTILSMPVHEAYMRRVPDTYRRMLSQFVEAHGLERYAFPDLQLPDSAYLPDGDHLSYSGAMRATQRFARYHDRH